MNVLSIGNRWSAFSFSLWWYDFIDLRFLLVIVWCLLNWICFNFKRLVCFRQRFTINFLSWLWFWGIAGNDSFSLFWCLSCVLYSWLFFNSLQNRNSFWSRNNQRWKLIPPRFHPDEVNTVLVSPLEQYCKLLQKTYTTETKKAHFLSSFDVLYLHDKTPASAGVELNILLKTLLDSRSWTPCFECLTLRVLVLV